MRIIQLLHKGIENQATDLLLKVDVKPKFKIRDNALAADNLPVVTEKQMNKWADEILPDDLKKDFEIRGDVDFAIADEQGRRYRVNLFRQRQKISMVIRIIANKIYTLKELNLPNKIAELCQLKRGLILVTGATGCGKTTTLAAMIEEMNRTRKAHIVTIEDPIEFDFIDNQSIINQREIGIDAKNYADALRSSMRQSPDVIFVGELRDKESIETALMAAETGHLVISSLHTSDSVESISRILAYFPPEQHRAIQVQLCASLQAVVSQRLLTTRDQAYRVPAVEILIMNGFVRDAIMHLENLSKIHDAICNGGDVYGMLSFDDSLVKLYEAGFINSKEALKNASRPTDLELKLRGIAS